MSEADQKDPSKITKTIGDLGNHLTQEIETTRTTFTHGNRTKANVHLKYPLDLEGPEEKHYIRFVPKQIHSAPINQVRSSSTSSLARRLGRKIGEAAVIAAKGAALKAINENIPSSVVSGIGFAAGLLDKKSEPRARVQSVGSIMLYMPQSIREDEKSTWSDVGLGSIVGAGSNIADDLIAGGGLDTFKEKMESALHGGQVPIGTAAWGAQKLASRIGLSNVNSVLLKKANLALNPYLEVFFKGIDLRRFTFTFKFAPRNQKEAREVRDIIMAFKYFSAPTYTSENLKTTFRHPLVFDINYSNESKLHKFKTCALQGISIDHSASGTNSTFYDGMPVETDMTLSLSLIHI